MKNIYVKIISGNQNSINSKVIASPQKNLETGIECFLHEVKASYEMIYNDITIKFV